MAIEWERVRAEATTLTAFARIVESPVVRRDGTIQKRLEDYVDGIQVADLLRELLLVSDSEHYALFSETERAEFQFRLFRALALGGSVCQVGQGSCRGCVCGDVV